MRRKIIICGLGAILLIGIVSTQVGNLSGKKDKNNSQKNKYEYYYNEDGKSGNEDVKKSENDSQKKKNVKYIEVDTKPDSYTVLVNRDYLISKDYIPADLVVPNIPFSFSGTYEKSYMRKRAARALEKLFAGALKKGYTLKGVSAYRSYERQMQIYKRNVATRGKKTTNKVSALPGSSEHQTGLAIDVSCEAVNCTIEESFGKTEEGKWLKKNCYKYGFIIRYPKKKSKITGYSYEPWHIRYVGKNLAKYLYENKLTLEEYYKLTTLDNKVQDDTIQDKDTNMDNEPEMTSAPTPKATIIPTPTPNYEATATPKATKKPKQTKKPQKTKKHQATKKPKKVTVTKKPQITKKPVVTKAPVVTKKPEATKKPEVTKKPEITEPPVDDSEKTGE